MVIKVLLPDSCTAGRHLPRRRSRPRVSGEPPADVDYRGRADVDAAAGDDRRAAEERARASHAPAAQAPRPRSCRRWLIGRTAPGIGSMERPSATTTGATTYDSANELRLIEFSPARTGSTRDASSTPGGSRSGWSSAPPGRDLDDDVQRPARGRWSPSSVSHRDDGPRRRARGSEAGRDSVNGSCRRETSSARSSRRRLPLFFEDAPEDRRARPRRRANTDEQRQRENQQSAHRAAERQRDAGGVI